jgi:hypothetical protein
MGLECVKINWVNMATFFSSEIISTGAHCATCKAVSLVNLHSLHNIHNYVGYVSFYRLCMWSVGFYVSWLWLRRGLPIQLTKTYRPASYSAKKPT